ncbi:MAG TPA: 23S rRNA (uridine(2552)-2'-O)-methyltransferase RlmE [Pseudomonadales bacterium]|nr:23S rRNA (uridine(2552)-2'-O)-methyltransferase RlmE [Pseudomonadales bacterium]
MSRSKSSDQWLKEHFDDTYVKQAQENGYRSRACFKLLEIQNKDRIFKKGMTVIDLGAAPGGWSQLAAEWVGSEGRVLASDILPMDALPGVTFIQGDFTSEEVYQNMLQHVPAHGADLVISDMAPNMSGNRAQDQARSMYLCELALDFAQNVLKPKGNFLIKVFQGEGLEAYRADLQARFTKLQTRKPDASRARSREVYYLATGFKRL